MTTSVFISDETISMVCGAETGMSFKIHGCARRDVPPGTISSGRIAESETLKELLKSMFMERRIEKSDVQLVLEGSISQIMNVPKVSPARMRRLVANEFDSQNGAGRNLLCDYSVICEPSRASGGKILGCALEKGLVGQYIELFSTLDVKLKSATVGVQSILLLSAYLGGKISKKTFVISLLYGNKMLSYLFNGGEYAVMVHNTMTQKRGSAASAVEISRNLSALSQYSAAQQEYSKIDTVYMAGMQGEELNFSGEISTNLDVSVEQLKSIFKVKGGYRVEELFNYGDYVYCLGDLIQTH